MIKWFVSDFSLTENVYKVVGAWPNGMAVQIDVGMTEKLEDTLRKINEATAVAYMQMAEGFLLGNVQINKASKSEEGGIQERIGTGNSRDAKEEQGKVQV